MANDELRSVFWDRALAWVHEHGFQDHICPLCGQNSWAIGDVLDLPTHGALELAEVYPVFPLTCQTCGYAVFFNAVAAGLLPRIEEEDTGEEEEPSP
jgi:predicted nucleic-acid-binding Zn-ribbon protein